MLVFEIVGIIVWIYIYLFCYSNGWIDFWSIPIAALSINYTYHPMPPYGPPPQADITTPEKEEILLSPMRMTGRKNPSVLHFSKVNLFIIVSLVCTYRFNLVFFMVVICSSTLQG